MDLGHVKKAKIPDDIQLLHRMMEQDLLVNTPSQDYDDSYCINYAKKFNAFMVTNDKFRDYIDKMYDVMREHENAPEESKSKQKRNKKNGKGNNSPQNDLQS